MELQSCLHPVRIKKKYSDEYIYVPCGKCASCRLNHNRLWVSRLSKECNSWPYTFFITLTYNDDNLPIAIKFGDTFVGQTPRHGSMESPVLSRKDFYDFCLQNSLDVETELQYFDNASRLPYTSVSDIQGFIKRLRKNLADKVQKYRRDVPKDKQLFGCLNSKIRFFCAAEYGPTTLRPHYHIILWTASELFANNYKTFISQAWQFGFNKSEFALRSDETCSYCAKYVNCITDMPAVYRTKSFRPKCQFSRFPAIGTLQDSPEKVREIFDNCTCKEVVRNAKDNTFIDSEIWRYYKDRVFPRITLFDKFSPSCRVKLYRAAERFGQNALGDFDYNVFDVNIHQHAQQHPDLYTDYLKFLEDNSKTDDYYPVKRWFYISSRVCTQSASWSIDVATYVYRIEQFYSKLNYEHLKDFYHFQEEFSKNNESQYLIGMYLDTLNKLLSLPSEYATDYHAAVLSSFDIPPDEFFGLDSEERKQKFKFLYPDSNAFGFNYRTKVMYQIAESTKVKKKNDYNGVFGSKLVNNG